MRYPRVIRCSVRQAKRMEPKVRAERERQGKESNRREKKRPVSQARRRNGEYQSEWRRKGSAGECMHGIALHCVATGKDRLMGEQGNGLDPVSQSGFHLYCTCLVPGVPPGYRGVQSGRRMAGYGTVWAYYGTWACTSPPAHRRVVRARRYMPCSSGPVTGCVPVFVDAACIGF